MGYLVLFIQCLLLVAPILGQRSWDRFKYIDQYKTDTNTNYLFRGNEPSQHGQMQYDWLVCTSQFMSTDALDVFIRNPMHNDCVVQVSGHIWRNSLMVVKFLFF